MDRLEAMSTLVAAVDAGSLSKAARRSGVPLATVSRRVAQLEEHLGTRILNRSGRQLTLTDAGHAYLLACKRILEQVNEAERAATGEYSSPKGELIVTAPLVFGRTHALPVVVEFVPKVARPLRTFQSRLDLNSERVRQRLCSRENLRASR
jgi:DNA-binding transcriptional LysR family regulator